MSKLGLGGQVGSNKGEDKGVRLSAQEAAPGALRTAGTRGELGAGGSG